MHKLLKAQFQQINFRPLSATLYKSVAYMKVVHSFKALKSKKSILKILHNYAINKELCEHYFLRDVSKTLQ